MHEMIRRGICLRAVILLAAVAASFGGVPGCAQPTIQEREYDAPQQFLLGPEDVVEIAVWKNLELTKTLAIRPDGAISMPIIGEVQAAGLTTDALAQRVTERLKPFIANPSVSVSVKDLNSYAVFVVGEVTKPGKYQLKSYATVLQAISLAGGFTDFAKKNKMQVVRLKSNGDQKLREIHIPVRYDDVVAGRIESGNMILLSGDTVVVP
ncbi:putative Polysaccharide export protein [Nitrospira japonica]|uniref:Putative Polysaccharide export protein n=1 Tax=Nitrospira japonica TaxID=1325564 RepID=A0A1W1IAP4_9BACT|nr:putative Polysaccharide export protein [Nitrospira japonica]